MTNATITRHEKPSTGSHLIEAECGKHRAHIWVSSHHVMVCCLNASHRAWGGLGKRFDTIEDAFASYKSAAMQAILRTAADALREHA